MTFYSGPRFHQAKEIIAAGRDRRWDLIWLSRCQSIWRSWDVLVDMHREPGPPCSTKIILPTGNETPGLVLNNQVNTFVSSPTLLLSINPENFLTSKQKLEILLDSVARGRLVDKAHLETVFDL